MGSAQLDLSISDGLISNGWSNSSPWSNKGLLFVLNENHKSKKEHYKISAKHLKMLKNVKTYLIFNLNIFWRSSHDSLDIMMPEFLNLTNLFMPVFIL